MNHLHYFVRFTFYFLFFLGNWGLLSAQDPDIEAREREVEAELFRTSQQLGETPTNTRQRRAANKRQSAPEGSFRVGCECMDGSVSGTRSTGSCSGRGGVRYWLYRTAAGDTARVLTARHELHPHALTANELSELAQKRVDKTERMVAANPIAQRLVSESAPKVVIMPPAYDPNTSSNGYDWLDWSDATGLGLAGLSLYATVRMILRWLDTNPPIVRYALRHFIRYRRRPTTRKGGSNPPSARG
jgi:hypothetical protein